MKKVIAILCISTSLIGCSLFENVPIYTIGVNSYSTNKTILSTYFLEKDSTCKYDFPYLEAEIEQYIENMFSQKNMRRVDSEKTETVITYNYDFNYQVVEKKGIKPVYGISGTTTSVNGKVETTGYGYSETNKLSGTSNTTINRKVVGYDSYNYLKNEYLKSLVIEAKQNGKELWKVTSVTKSGGEDHRKMYPYMVASIIPYFNINTYEIKEVTIKGNDKTYITILGQQK